MIKCLGCDNELDDLGKYGFCSSAECRLRVQGFEIAMRRIVDDPWIQKAALREIGGNSMTKCDGCVQEIRKLLDSAKREPAHSPTEDALIDAVEMLLELVTSPTFPRSSQNQTASSGVEGAHEGNTADKSGAASPELLPTQLPKEK